MVTYLNFTANFNRNDNIVQEYFLFTGDYGSAQFSRQNLTNRLTFTQDHEINVYEANITSEFIIFRWPVFLNNSPMKLIKGNGNVTETGYQIFNFMNSEIESQAIINNPTIVNYRGMVGIFLGIIILFRSPGIVKYIITRYFGGNGVQETRL